MTDTSVKSLLEAGVHFGHRAHRWNPKMSPYLFGVRSGVHIIDLDQTVGYLHQAQEQVTAVTSRGGKVLFVGTKRQGKAAIAKAAGRAGMPYVTERWLGGMLTNFTTIKERLARLNRLREEHANHEWDHLPKKELARKREELKRLETVLGGVSDLTETPAAVYVNDVVREDLAVREAKKLGIPVIGVVDSNADPRQIDYPIPGNDDAVMAITVIAEAIADAAAAGAAAYAAQQATAQHEVAA